MISKLPLAGLAIVLGSWALAPAALASDATDPHQQARERIVPPFPSHAAASAGALGRPAAFQGDFDPHARAAALVEHRYQFRAPMHRESRGEAAGGKDPHRRAQDMILGRGW